jgi:NAD(P)H-flavin reductase
MEELLYTDQHAQWAQQPKVDVTTTIDRPQDGWTGRTGMVTTLLKGLDVDKPNSCCFVCGPGVMLKFTTQALLGEGFEPDHLHESSNELWHGPLRAVQHRTALSLQRRTGHELRADQGLPECVLEPLGLARPARGVGACSSAGRREVRLAAGCP